MGRIQKGRVMTRPYCPVHDEDDEDRCRAPLYTCTCEHMEEPPDKSDDDWTTGLKNPECKPTGPSEHGLCHSCGCASDSFYCRGCRWDMRYGYDGDPREWL